MKSASKFRQSNISSFLDLIDIVQEKNKIAAENFLEVPFGNSNAGFPLVEIGPNRFLLKTKDAYVQMFESQKEWLNVNEKLDDKAYMFYVDSRMALKKEGMVDMYSPNTILSRNYHGTRSRQRSPRIKRDPNSPARTKRTNKDKDDEGNVTARSIQEIKQLGNFLSGFSPRKQAQFKSDGFQGRISELVNEEKDEGEKKGINLTCLKGITNNLIDTSSNKHVMNLLSQTDRLPYDYRRSIESNHRNDSQKKDAYEDLGNSMTSQVEDIKANDTQANYKSPNQFHTDSGSKNKNSDKKHTEYGLLRNSSQTGSNLQMREINLNQDSIDQNNDHYIDIKPSLESDRDAGNVINIYQQLDKRTSLEEKNRSSYYRQGILATPLADEDRIEIDAKTESGYESNFNTETTPTQENSMRFLTKLESSNTNYTENRSPSPSSRNFMVPTLDLKNITTGQNSPTHPSKLLINPLKVCNEKYVKKSPFVKTQIPKIAKMIAKKTDLVLSSGIDKRQKVQSTNSQKIIADFGRVQGKEDGHITKICVTPNQKYLVTLGSKYAKQWDLDIFNGNEQTQQAQQTDRKVTFRSQLDPLMVYTISDDEYVSRMNSPL